MIAYVRMQLLRWLRRTLGIGLLVAAVFLPTFMVALWLVVEGTPQIARNASAFVSIVANIVIIGSSVSLVNQLSAVVEEEARLNRSTLLRVGDLDGFRAVGAYSLLGLVLAFLHGTLGFVGPALLGLMAGVPVPTWLAPSATTTLLLSAYAPPATLGAFLLPRVLGLVLLNGGAFVASVLLASGPHLSSGRLSAGLVGGVLLVHAAVLVGGGLLWRAKSASLW
ncbi:MAG: hypothetical protein U0529_22675 [Thermoanaerobaculia bacterium]